MSIEQRVNLEIEGMHCGNCVARVARALTSVDGVEVESLAIGKATVNLAGTDASPDDLVNAVERAGYKATVSTG